MGHHFSEDIFESFKSALNPFVIEKNHANIYGWTK